MGFPRQEYWSGTHTLLQGIFLTQGSNLGLLHCRQILDRLSRQGSPLQVPADAAQLLQSCPTLCDPIDGSPPGAPIPGILQARTLEWIAISFSNNLRLFLYYGRILLLDIEFMIQSSFPSSLEKIYHFLMACLVPRRNVLSFELLLPYR